MYIFSVVSTIYMGWIISLIPEMMNDYINSPDFEEIDKLIDFRTEEDVVTEQFELIQ